ncbi:MAG: nucleoside triphosphate pyrophosphohydrolase [Beduini sp.]|uniref:nucleoside triphosphate pyrophosphohydrolase n=1 Tax=Beduini sp. TaxID=1922300 RepID=UPI0039A26C68
MKLVRDKIPEIIAGQNKKAVISVMNDEEYYQALLMKLSEETHEFLVDQNEEELCDILEVVYALAETMNVSITQLEQVRKEKKERNGAFKKRLRLERIMGSSDE